MSMMKVFATGIAAAAFVLPTVSDSVDELDRRYNNTLQAAYSLIQSYLEQKPFQLDVSGVETVQGFAWNGQQQFVEDMKASLQRDDMVAAKSTYDRINETVKSGHTGLLQLVAACAEEQNNPNAQELMRRAAYFAYGMYNQEKVTLRDGTETTIGQALKNPEAFNTMRRKKLSANGLSPKAADLYLAGDAVMRGIVRGGSTFGRAVGTDRPTPSNSAAIRDFANVYAERKQEFDEIFGAGAQQLASDISEFHRDAGSAVQTFSDLLAYGRSLKERNPEADGRDFAHEVFSGYRDLLAASFLPETSEHAPGISQQKLFTQSQQRQFGVVFGPAVRQTLAKLPKGAKLDLHDPLFRRAFAEVQDVLSYVSAAGGFTAARTFGTDLNNAFGDYVASSVLGLKLDANNIVAQVRSLRADMQYRIHGGHDMRGVATELMGCSADYFRSIPKTLGGESSCKVADAMAVDVHQCLVRGLLNPMTRGRQWGQYLSDERIQRKIAESIALRLRGHFMGFGSLEAATAVATAVVSQYVRGERVVIEDVIANLAYSAAANFSPDAQKTLRAWHFGNATEPLRYGEDRSGAR